MNNRPYRDIQTFLDLEQKVFWCYMNPLNASCFTLGLLNDLHACFLELENNYRDGAKVPFHYFVLASRMPGRTFNHGGDLSLFATLIRSRDRDGLRHYAHLCIDALYRIVINFNLPVLSIALVKGEALAGGLEVALANDMIIAEKQAIFGVPEIHFGLFPGMGAYSFLSRRIGRKEAEKMIFSGDTYTAEQLYALGLVDILAENGKAEEALQAFISDTGYRQQTYKNLYKIRNRVDSVSYDELIDITDIWVDTAMYLTETDVRRMEKLALRQKRRLARSMPIQPPPAEVMPQVAQSSVAK